MKLYEIDPVMNLRKGLSALDPKAAGLPLGFLLFLWTAQAHQKAQLLGSTAVVGKPRSRWGLCKLNESLVVDMFTVEHMSDLSESWLHPQMAI